MSLPSNPLLVPRLSQVRIQILWLQRPHTIVSFRHLTVCFSVQRLARLLSSTITTCFPSSPRFRTRSRTRPWVATPARQTTLTLTTCHGASKSSKRRPNLSKPHVCPTVCPLDGISRRRREKKKRKAPGQVIYPQSSLKQWFSNYCRHWCHIFTLRETKCTGVFLVVVIFNPNMKDLLEFEHHLVKTFH